ncbi:MAG: tyrosine-type recombinase/integrase [Actinomycetota bacterium]|nr:tyrosine-type recombinase/integrase [Actinomycetota bacterium]
MRSFKTLLKRADLPLGTRLYDLRHTCATLLLSSNVHPKYVQELLGHASISQTLDTYSHVLKGMGRRDRRRDGCRSRLELQTTVEDPRCTSQGFFLYRIFGLSMGDLGVSRPGLEPGT